MAKKNNKRKRTPIPLRTKLILVGQAAGLCEFPGCGKRLYEDWVTKEEVNNINFAHIIADSPDGPRGDVVLSKQLCKDISNLMLLCPDCHTKIDSDPKKYTVEILRKFKKDHEDKIRRITEIKDKTSSTILIYTANIGNNKCHITYEEANEAIQPEHFPADKYPATISMNHAGHDEKDENYWKDEVDNLKYMFSQTLKRGIDAGHINHISVFAIAPMPLLVKLGSMLSDLKDVDVYQLHREPRTWKWQDAEDREIFRIIRPERDGKKPVLVFALSSEITERVSSYYNPDAISLWVVTIDHPNNDYLKSKEQLSEFRKKVRSVLEDINHHSEAGEVDVYMAMSNACAVELGRMVMPKADRNLVLFDFNKGLEKDIQTITIK